MTVPTLNYLPDDMQISSLELSEISRSTTQERDRSPSLPPLPIFGTNDRGPEVTSKAYSYSAPDFSGLQRVSRTAQAALWPPEDPHVLGPDGFSIPEGGVFHLEL